MEAGKVGKVCRRGGRPRVARLAARQANGLNNIRTLVAAAAAARKTTEERECFGEFTREVYNAICLRLGDTLYIPEDSVQALFNDMKLFPSKSQVSKMLQCARQCSRRNGSKDYLTFGEFCVFVREMQNSQSPRKASLPKISNKCPTKCEVFLGGSCNPTTWRADTAIPELQKHGITFYNPQVSMWAPELLAEEHNAKQSASVLLFVIDSQTRSTVGMLEVAYLVASGRCVVVVAQPYKSGQSIMGETVTNREYMDLMEGQKTVLNLVKAKGVKIHTNLPTALQCTANILRNTSTTGTSAEELITYKLRKLREVYDTYNGQMDHCSVLDAYEKLTNRSPEINKLYNYLGGQNGNNRTRQAVSFEKFCVLMAEFSTGDGCDMCTSDGRYAGAPHWSCTLLKTRRALSAFLVRPIATAIVWATQRFQRQVSTNNNGCNANKVDNASTTAYDVYLGGSLTSAVAWREETAAPLLKKHGLEYYNPAIRENDNGNGSDWDENMLDRKRAIDDSKVLVFAVTNDTRSLTTMVLAAYYMGTGKEVVLCVQQLEADSCVVKNETLTKNAVKDYNRARVYLRDLAERRGVPVFDNITEAVECAVAKATR